MSGILHRATAGDVLRTRRGFVSMALWFGAMPWTVLAGAAEKAVELPYVFIKTGGSLVLAIALHTAFNASPNIVEKLFPALESNTAVRESAYVAQIVAIALVSAGCFLFDRSVRSVRP
jgi:hypothetical protein